MIQGIYFDEQTKQFSLIDDENAIYALTAHEERKKRRLERKIEKNEDILNTSEKDLYDRYKWGKRIGRTAIGTVGGGITGGLIGLGVSGGNPYAALKGVKWGAGIGSVTGALGANKAARRKAAGAHEKARKKIILANKRLEELKAKESED